MNKKIIASCSLMFLVLVSAKADPLLDFTFQPGYTGSEFIFFTKNSSSGLIAELFDFNFENRNTGIGFKLSPLSIRTVDEAENKFFSEMYFLNFSFYWNLLNSNIFPDDNEMALGPFFSLRYLSLVNWQIFDFNNITLNAGLKLIYRINPDDSLGKTNVIDMELGYKYNYYNGHSLYVAMMVDLNLFVRGIILLGEVLAFFIPVPAEVRINERY